MDRNLGPTARLFRFAVCGVLLSLVPLGCDNPDSRPMPAQVPLQTVTDEALTRDARRYQGRVVLLYFWASHSPVDVKMFPPLVTLAERFRGANLVLLSVSLDAVGEDRRMVERVERVLAQQGRFDANYLLADSNAIGWHDHWKIDEPPAFVVLNRQGDVDSVIDLAGSETPLEDLAAVLKRLMPDPTSP